MSERPVPPFIVPAPIDDAGLSVYQFRALAHVTRRAGPGGLYYGGGTSSAKTCRMGRRQWWRALRDLVRLGYLEVVSKAEGCTTTYRCLKGTGSPQAPVRRFPTGTPTGSSPAHPPVPLRHTKESQGRSPSKESRQPPTGNETDRWITAHGGIASIVDQLVAAGPPAHDRAYLRQLGAPAGVLAVVGAALYHRRKAAAS